MSYTYTRSVQFKTMANMAAAMPTCRSIADYINKVSKLDTQLMAPTMGGSPNNVVFVIRGDDLGKMEATFEASMKDPAYLSLLGQMKEHVVGTATRDQVWKIVG